MAVSLNILPETGTARSQADRQRLARPHFIRRAAEVYPHHLHLSPTPVQRVAVHHLFLYTRLLSPASADERVVGAVQSDLMLLLPV